MVFNKMCSTTTVSGENVLLCSNLPAGVKSASLPYSKLQGSSVSVNLNLRGIDRIVFCADYNTPSTCQSFRLDDHTSVRLEIVPADQLTTYQIQKPQCETAGAETASYLSYSNCSIPNAFVDNGTYWTLNGNCFPTSMNVPVMVFCSTWSK